MTPEAGAPAGVRTVPFVKMSGAGNDFVMFDNRETVFAEQGKPALARRLCRRRFSIGADGLILIERPAAKVGADFAMRYFNADGSEGELCGNGARCAAVFALEIGAARTSQRFSTPAGVLRATVLRAPSRSGEDAVVRVAMAPPGPVRRLRLPDLPGGPAELFVLRVGVPHAVEVVADVAAVDVGRRGRAIRRHPAFPAIRPSPPERTRTSSRWTGPPERSGCAPSSGESRPSPSPAAPAPPLQSRWRIASSAGRRRRRSGSRAGISSVSIAPGKRRGWRDR